MANILFVLSAMMALQACIYAAPNTEKQTVDTLEEITVQAGPKLATEANGASGPAEVNEDKIPQGQRQKRFYNYFDIDFTPYSPYNPNYIKRDDLQDTGVYGSRDFFMQILRRLQTIANYTRQQFLTPQITHYPVPSFIPIFYSPPGACACTPAESPGDNDESKNVARPTQHTATMPPVGSTTQAIVPATNGGPSPTDDTDVTSSDLSNRFQGDEGDGSRPISFIPVTPKTPLQRPAPPVEHGSVQASRPESEFSTTTPRPVVTGLPPQPHLPTSSIPTLCDIAVLSCCHRAEVTYDCFKSQGCPNPASPDNPCNENNILKVIAKFQYYYANRRS